MYDHHKEQIVLINRVRLPILLEPRSTGKINIALSPYTPKILVTQDAGSTVSPSRVSLLILQTQAKPAGAYHPCKPFGFPRWGHVFISLTAFGSLLSISSRTIEH